MLHLNPHLKIFFHHKKKAPVPGLLYPIYWHFASEMQKVFFKKTRGQKMRLTADAILNTYQFKNIYRASNLREQFLIGQVIYCGDQSMNEVFLRIILFRLCYSIEQWKCLKKTLGNICIQTFHPEKYSLAFKQTTGHFYLAQLHLLYKAFSEGIPQQLQKCKTLFGVYYILKKFFKLNAQLAYNITIDLNYSKIINFTEMEFVKVSRAAKAGIEKIFNSTGSYTDDEIVALMAHNQQFEFNRMGIKFETLYGRPLQLTDCETIFCEVDKYIRLGFGSNEDISGIKKNDPLKDHQPGLIKQWYPPKWKINDLL